MERPAIAQQPDGAAFRRYYYRKEALAAFCREHGLPAAGSKQALTDRIAVFLDTGTAPPACAGRKRPTCAGDIGPDTKIGPDFACTQGHRAFFREQIGKTFSFRVPFQKWLRQNPDKTCGDAVRAYQQIAAAQKKEKTAIGAQFEYNAYIRDFFADNAGKTLGDAIRCWTYKKQMPGRHCYEKTDLAALK